jgi:hypothetical protein
MAACYRAGNLPERYWRRREEKGGRHVVRVPVHAPPVEPAPTATAPAGAGALVPGRGVAAVIARRESPNPLAVLRPGVSVVDGIHDDGAPGQTTPAGPAAGGDSPGTITRCDRGARRRPAGLVGPRGVGDITGDATSRPIAGLTSYFAQFVPR